MKHMWRNILGVFVVSFYILYSAFFSIFFVLPLGLIKYLVVKQSWQDVIRCLLNKVIQLWILLSNFLIDHVMRVKVIVDGLENLSVHKWYLVISNHISATDTVILAKIFNKKIPPPRFFMKSELVWMAPFIGIACFLMEFPCLKRYSKQKLEKNPALKKHDIKVLEKLGQHFKNIPVSIFTFAEGTRVTQKKIEQQHSPYRHLLKPKAGGILMALSTMGKQLSCILDVSIVYPEKSYSFWDFLCGRVKKILIHVNKIHLSEEFLKNASDNPMFRANIQEWVNQVWAKKDESIERMLSSAS